MRGSLLPSPWERGGRTWRQPACKAHRYGLAVPREAYPSQWEGERKDPTVLILSVLQRAFPCTFLTGVFPGSACFCYERGDLTLILTTISPLKTKYLQTLLKGKALWDLHLPASNWTVEDVARFLSNNPEDFETENGSLYTWVDAFNETDRAIQTISRFMEVRSC